MDGALSEMIGRHMFSGNVGEVFVLPTGRYPVRADLVLFAGLGTFDTSGRTDVVMKLFGPDSTTNVIAEDDDSGVGTNARIVADLVPGEYFVQIRHWDRASGTGFYSIKVVRNGGG